MLTLIENGDVYAPEPKGRMSLLLCAGKILKLGPLDPRDLDRLGLEYERIDADGCLVTPGLIDPHEHLLGGSGEKGFSTQTPEIHLAEIVGAGITTVVGCLGVDTTMKTPAGLLARAKALREEGLTAFIYSGGYNVPPTSILDSVRDDILFIDEVIGAGEVAVADSRATEPSAAELARLASNAHIGGLLSNKAGVTHPRRAGARPPGPAARHPRRLRGPAGVALPDPRRTHGSTDGRGRGADPPRLHRGHRHRRKRPAPLAAFLPRQRRRPGQADSFHGRVGHQPAPPARAGARLCDGRFRPGNGATARDGQHGARPQAAGQG